MNVINFIMDAGSSVFMPIIILILGLIFGLEFKKAFKAGVVVGIGFIVINLAIGLLCESLDVVIGQLVSLYDFKLTSLDVGWTIGAAIAWKSGIIVPIILGAVLLTNIILVAVGFTKTMDVDIWNYWGLLFVGNATYQVTGKIWVGVLASIIAMMFVLKMADFAAPRIEEAFGMPGITTCNVETVTPGLIAEPLDALINKIPGLNKIDWTPERIQEKLGIFGETWFLGAVMGLVLSLIARLDLSTILSTTMNVAASMYVLPKMIGVLMEGLLPITEAAQKFMQKKFAGKKIYIGLDAAVLCGHPSVVATQLLLIPTVLLLATVLPGNTTLPLAELGGITFLIVWAVMPSKGNVFRGWLIGTVIMAIVLLVASNLAPIMTQLGALAGYAIPESAANITCLTIGGGWFSWLVFKVLTMIF
ncbi:MAG: PTS galactitol transporter subunit IIC [Erysipelotrichaceae bacterium]|nr:PTS galactitol transporter subunit IIC [Erysipelotrichaceae bacterium]